VIEPGTFPGETVVRPMGARRWRGVVGRHVLLWPLPRGGAGTRKRKREAWGPGRIVSSILLFAAIAAFLLALPFLMSRGKVGLPTGAPVTGDFATVGTAPPALSSVGAMALERSFAHDSLGASQLSAKWYLAEGCTEGGFETFVLVQNPGEEPAQIALDFMTPQGTVEGPRQVLAPGTRSTFRVNDHLSCWEVSTRVSSDVPVVAERAVYGGARSFAHDSLGASQLSAKWYLAEGCTEGGFETFVLVQNPGEEPAQIALDFMTPQGTVEGPRQVLAPGTRSTFRVNDHLSCWEVSTRVSSDVPVVAERAVYGRRDAVVCLDPGHAETPYFIDPETGLNTRDWANHPEMEIVYDICLRARELLEAQGVKVVMTKSSVDEPVDLKQRALIANQAGALLILHVHTDPGLPGFTTFYPGPPPYDWKANTDSGRTAHIDPQVQAASQSMAPVFHHAAYARLRELAYTQDGGLRVEDRGATGTGNYGPIFTYDIWSEVPTFTLENNQDFADAHRQELAEAIAAGILACL